MHEVNGKCQVTSKFVTGANGYIQRAPELKEEECPFLPVDRVRSSGCGKNEISTLDPHQRRS